MRLKDVNEKLAGHTFKHSHVELAGINNSWIFAPTLCSSGFHLRISTAIDWGEKELKTFTPGEE